MSDPDDLCYILSKQEYNHSEALGALAAAGVVKVLLKCPAASATFFGAILCVEVDLFGATGGGLTLVEICEAPTTSADGTARTPVNKNRLDTPTNTTIGTFLNTDATGGTVMKFGYAQSAMNFESGPFILKPGVNYLVRATNQSGGTLVNGAIIVTMDQINNFDQMYKKGQ